jgi:hypothetical protein
VSRLQNEHVNLRHLQHSEILRMQASAQLLRAYHRTDLFIRRHTRSIADWGFRFHVPLVR